MILPFNWFRKYFDYKSIIEKGMKANINRFSHEEKQTLGDFIASYIDTKVRVTSADGVNN